MTLEPLPEGKAFPSSPDFLQSGFWAGFKSSFGWKPLEFLLSDDSRGDRGSGLLVLVRRLPFGNCFAYVGHGPHIDPSGSPADGAGISLERPGGGAASGNGSAPENRLSERLSDIAASLSPFLPRDCAFIRFDLPQYREATVLGTLSGPFRKASQDVQPPDTVIVDLRPSEELILQAMKPKWRYNVRLAEKKGVEIRVIDAAGSDISALDAALDEFYALYRETAERDRIALHGKEYYRKLFELAAKGGSAPSLRLYSARWETKTLAAIIVLFYGSQSVYLYGASSNEGRNLMPAYALQWRAMRDAKAAGCAAYDLFGIPPDDDPSHPMHGLYRFKTGFGGKVVHRLGCYDYPLRKGAYAAFRFAESLRSFYFKRLVKIGKRAEGGKERGKAESEGTS